MNASSCELSSDASRPMHENGAVSVGRHFQ